MKMNNRRAARRPRPGFPGPMARRRHRAGPVRFVASRAWVVGTLVLVLLLRPSAWEGGVAAQENGDDGSDDGSNDDGSTSAPAALYPDCEADMALVGDSLCDLDFNVAECGFDGGDCCECTCVDTGDQVCGDGGGGYFCVDPDAPEDCASVPSPTPNTPSSPTSSDAIDVTAGPTSLEADDDPYPGCGGYVPHIGDGYCDEDNNTAACGFDGGDCCACTCGANSEGELDHECGLLGDGYDCRDPDVPEDCSLANFAQCEGINGYDWQDGYCDDDLNTAECGYDGGDCCRCTCRDYDSWGYYNSCGYYGYDCLDPEAPSTCSTDSPTPSPAAGTDYPECEGYIYKIGDGYCDYLNNNEECDWDGGDCCACTCVSGTYTCGYYTFDCEDPSVSTDCSSTVDLYGDDFYDSDDYWESDDFYGTYWDSDDFYGADDVYGGTSWACISSFIGDGMCDDYNNNADCEWDGGDCCECDCDPYQMYECGVVGYDCLDPASSCSDVETTPSPASLTSEARGADSTSTSVSAWQIVGGFSVALLAFCCFSGIVYSSCLRCRGKLGDAADEQDSGGVGGAAAAAPAVATTGTQPPEPDGSGGGAVAGGAGGAATPAAK